MTLELENDIENLTETNEHKKNHHAAKKTTHLIQKSVDSPVDLHDNNHSSDAQYSSENSIIVEVNG